MTCSRRNRLERDLFKIPGGCWFWTGALDARGYGVVHIQMKLYKTHRLAFELFKGPLTSEIHVRHSCDVRCCCNPDHLSPGTNYDNVQDAVSRKRHAYGVRVAHAKLNDEDVRQIRRSTLSSRKMAKVLGVSNSTISSARRGETWKHVR